MKSIILAGGYGTRLSEETKHLPKPLVKIGKEPILSHIMNIYTTGGVNEFIIALGYKGEVIKDYFTGMENATCVKSDNDYLSIRLASPSGNSDRIIHLVETGLETMTGGRLMRLNNLVRDDGTFLMTYGDGVADLDIGKLMEFHKSHGRLATVTAVNPPERFGRILLEKDLVIGFNEKPVIADDWINGGFFVLNTGIFDYIEGDNTVWEREPMERLVQDRQLVAFKHHGFWSCMDTPAEQEYLNDLWNSGKAAWNA